MASFALKVTRLAFAVMGRVSPEIAGRAAFWLFCRTPSRKPKGGKAEAMFATGDAILSGAEFLSVRAPDGDIATYRLMGHRNAPRVMLIHGWGSRAEYLAVLAKGLNEAGAEVIVIDLPGHGRSYGKSLNVRSGAQAVSAVAQQCGPFDAAVAHSFGGLALMSAVGGMFEDIPPVNVSRLALIGAPSHVDEVFADFSEILKLSDAVKRGLFARVEELARIPVAAFDLSAIAKRLNIPMLVVHAEDDKEVGPHHARRYENCGSHISFYWANGWGHRRIVSAPVVNAAIARFLVLHYDESELARA